MHELHVYERFYGYIRIWCVKAPSFALSNHPTLQLQRGSSLFLPEMLILIAQGEQQGPGEHCQNVMSWTWLDHNRSQFAWKILACVCVCVCGCLYCSQACVEMCCADAAGFTVCIHLRWQLLWAHEVVRQLMMVRLSASMAFRTSRFGPMSHLNWIQLDSLRLCNDTNWIWWGQNPDSKGQQRCIEMPQFFKYKSARLTPVSLDILSLSISEWLLREYRPEQFLFSLSCGTLQARKKLRHLLQAFRLTQVGRARQFANPQPTASSYF